MKKKLLHFLNNHTVKDYQDKEQYLWSLLCPTNPGSGVQFLVWTDINWKRNHKTIRNFIIINLRARNYISLQGLFYLRNFSEILLSNPGTLQMRRPCPKVRQTLLGPGQTRTRGPVTVWTDRSELHSTSTGELT